MGQFQSISPPDTVNTMCTNTLYIVIVACLNTGLAIPSRSRPGEVQEFREKFSYGHDDEPDYNSDHSYPVSYEYESYQHTEPEVVKEKFLTEEEQGEKTGFNFGTFHHGTHSAQSQTEAEESPSMREFTLIISRLLFHLSQM